MPTAAPSSWGPSKMVVSYPEPSPLTAFFADDPFAATPYYTPPTAPLATSTQEAARESYFPQQPHGITSIKSHIKRVPSTLLLESFPVPPSHIPAPAARQLQGGNASFTLSTPTSASFGYSIDIPRSPPPIWDSIQPPPSPIGRPPSLPLPALPGPSPISEHETMMFMTASSSGSRSRRASKMSIRSASSQGGDRRSSHDQGDDRSSGLSSNSADHGLSTSSIGHHFPPPSSISPATSLSGRSPSSSVPGTGSATNSVNTFGIPASRRDSLLSVTELREPPSKPSHRGSVVSNRSVNSTPSSAPSSAYPRTPSYHEQQMGAQILEELVEESAYGGMIVEDAIKGQDEGDLTKVDITELSGAWGEEDDEDANESVLDILSPSITRRMSDMSRDAYASPRNGLAPGAQLGSAPSTPSKAKTPPKSSGNFVSRLSQRMSLVTSPPARLLSLNTDASTAPLVGNGLKAPTRGLHTVVSTEDLSNSEIHANDSIASINMNDLPGGEDQGQELVFPTTEADEDAKAYADAQAFHLRMRATRSRSNSHKQMLQSKSRTTSPRRALDLDRQPPSLPSDTSSIVTLHAAEEESRRAYEEEQRREAMYREIDAEEEARAASPDIKTILSTTPRPRRKSVGSALSRRSSRSSAGDLKGSFASGSRSSYTDSARPTRRRVSEGVSRPGSCISKTGSARRTSGTESARSIQDVLRKPSAAMSPPSSFYEKWDENDEEDYGVQVENSHLRTGLRDSSASYSSYGRDSYGSDTHRSMGVSDDERTGRSDEEFVPSAEHDNEYQKMLETQLGLDMGVEEEETYGGSDSDSSLDLHTPLPHLMMRHGLLNPNSKLLPKANGLRSPSPGSGSGRPGSTMSMASTATKKDDRNTPQRRVRHRDGRMLRGGIGLTTGLGWSDSEDEDAPSALTRRISKLNMTRRASLASLRPSPSSSSVAEMDSNWASASTGAISKPRSSLPPSSFTRQKSLHDLSRNGPPSSRKLGRASSESASTLEVSIPEEPCPLDSISRRKGEEASFFRDRAESVASVRTLSSTASTVSLPVPVTPNGDEDLAPLAEKVLPPLPALRKYPSTLGLRSSSSSSNIARASQMAPPRTRTISTTSSVSSGGRGSGALPLSSSVSTSSIRAPSSSYSSKSTPRTPRPLQLGSGNLVREAPSSFSPLSPSLGGTNCKSRTGTGMVYRKSGSHTPSSSFGASASASRMRMPSQSAVSKGIVL